MSVRKEGLALPFRSDPGMGRGPPPDLGRNGSPGPFLFCFLLFFSGFFILLYLLQKCFKTTQTTFRNFLKFTVRFQTNMKHVFRIKTRFLVKDLN
jgi:hypothetical protein